MFSSQQTTDKQQDEQGKKKKRLNKTKNIIFYQLILLISFISACTAAPQGSAYAVEDLPPQPYAYQYGVEDVESNSSFQKSESQVRKYVV